MKKFWVRFLTVMLAVFMAVSFAACNNGKDDKNEEEEPTTFEATWSEIADATMKGMSNATATLKESTTEPGTESQNEFGIAYKDGNFDAWRKSYLSIAAVEEGGEDDVSAKYSITAARGQSAYSATKSDFASKEALFSAKPADLSFSRHVGYDGSSAPLDEASDIIDEILSIGGLTDEMKTAIDAIPLFADKLTINEKGTTEIDLAGGLNNIVAAVLKDNANIESVFNTVSTELKLGKTYDGLSDLISKSFSGDTMTGAVLTGIDALVVGIAESAPEVAEIIEDYANMPEGMLSEFSTKDMLYLAILMLSETDGDGAGDVPAATPMEMLTAFVEAVCKSVDAEYTLPVKGEGEDAEYEYFSALIDDLSEVSIEQVYDAAMELFGDEIKTMLGITTALPDNINAFVYSALRAVGLMPIKTLAPELSAVKGLNITLKVTVNADKTLAGISAGYKLDLSVKNTDGETAVTETVTTTEKITGSIAYGNVSLIDTSKVTIRKTYVYDAFTEAQLEGWAENGYTIDVKNYVDADKLAGSTLVLSESYPSSLGVYSGITYEDGVITINKSVFEAAKQETNAWLICAEIELADSTTAVFDCTFDFRDLIVESSGGAVDVPAVVNP